MKKKNKQIGLTILLLSAVLFTVPLKAQVTIGAQTVPNSTLEVVALPAGATTADGIMAPRLTLAQINARKSLYGVAQTGAMVYVTDTIGGIKPGYSDQITCTGLVYWSGDHWVSDCGEQEHYVNATSQPKAFSFYEQGTEPVVPLVFTAEGSSAITYQWYKIVGKNINFRVSAPCTAADGAGFNTSTFTPTSVEKGSTLIAANNGSFKYFCVAKNNVNDSVVSIVTEVAVGCGGNDMYGNWISFMCFNLGASNQTIASQKTTSIPLVDNGAVVANTFLHSANERTTYGDLYQWGRIADGHENRNAIPVGNTGGVDATDNCISWNTTTPPTYENGNVAGGTYSPTQQVTRGTSYYGKFIKTIAANDNNWYVGTQSDADLLWRESSFPYNDPCAKVNTTTGAVPSGNTPDWYPATGGTISNSGWRIPNQFEWASLYRGGSTSGSPANAFANTWSWYQLAAGTEGAKGYELKPDGATTTLFLPTTGYRYYYNALLYFSGANGYYWSGSVSGVDAFTLNINSGTVYPANIYHRGLGFALRCVKN